MAAMASVINGFLRSGVNCRLTVSYEEEVGGCWSFRVHDHHAWPGVSECSNIDMVQLPNCQLHATGAPYTVGFHGTTPTNVFLILLTNGFDVKYSGDELAGVYLARTMSASGSYNWGGVLQCSIEGFQARIDSGSPLTPKKHDFQDWSRGVVPVGANIVWRNRGSPGGQVLAHPGNLCIERIFINKNLDIPLLLSEDLLPIGGASFGIHDNSYDAQARFEAHLASRTVLSPPRDLRPFAPKGPLAFHPRRAYIAFDVAVPRDADRERESVYASTSSSSHMLYEGEECASPESA